MHDLVTIKRMNGQAVKKWRESKRQKLNRLRKEVADLEARVEGFDKAADEEGEYGR